MEPSGIGKSLNVGGFDHGGVTERRGSGLQSRVHGFKSRLHLNQRLLARGCRLNVWGFVRFRLSRCETTPHSSIPHPSTSFFEDRAGHLPDLHETSGVTRLTACAVHVTSNDLEVEPDSVADNGDRCPDGQ